MSAADAPLELTEADLEQIAAYLDARSVKVAKAIRMALWKVAFLAFVAMCINDLLGTAMVIFESEFNAPLAGLMDVLGYLASLACNVLALDSILTNGVRNRRSLTIISAVSAANYVGTYAGVAVGQAIAGGHH